jgi:hypothetical protein
MAKLPFTQLSATEQHTPHMHRSVYEQTTEPLQAAPMAGRAVGHVAPDWPPAPD